MMTVIYLAITAAVLALTLWNLFREEDPRWQLNAALAAIPLILRVLLIK